MLHEQMRPVRPEPEFHRNARDDAHTELMPKMRPQNRASSSYTGAFVRKRKDLEHEDDEREAIRELREEVVVRHRETELQSAPRKRVHDGVIESEATKGLEGRAIALG
jgi:hypothetical protein